MCRARGRTSLIQHLPVHQLPNGRAIVKGCPRQTIDTLLANRSYARHALLVTILDTRHYKSAKVAILLRT